MKQSMSLEYETSSEPAGLTINPSTDSYAKTLELLARFFSNLPKDSNRADEGFPKLKI